VAAVAQREAGVIEAAAASARLIQRLRARAERLVAGRSAVRRRRRSDWHSAAALWPDLFGDDADGK
jgi:hypothetical protein